VLQVTTSPALTAASSNAVNVTAGAASQLTITTPAAGAIYALPFATQPVVALRDAQGNLIITDNASVVTMSVSVGGTVIGTATATANAGVVTFLDVGIVGVAGTEYTLTFSSAALAAATQPIVVAAGVPSGLSYPGAPPTTTFGTAGSSTAPTLASAAGGVVTYSITSPSPLPAGITIDPITGVVSWSADLPAGTYNLTIMASTAGGSTTAPLTLTVAPLGVTVRPDAGQSKVFGSPDPVFTYTTSPSVVLTGALDRFLGEEVRTHAFTLGTLTGGPNYTLVMALDAPVFTILSGVPSAPLGLAGVAGDQSVQLTWTGPVLNGGSAITGYVVEYRTAGGDWVRLPVVNSPQQLVTMLQNERLYHFRVAAVNAAGEGPFSSPDLVLAPRAPVEELPGELPEPNPGEAVYIVDGVVRELILEVVDSVRVQLRSDDFRISIQGVSDAGQPVQISPTNLILRLQQGGTVRVRGDGFAPGTVASIWLFSTPILLGQVPVDEFGDFQGELPIPAGISIGQHTVQVTGIDRTASRRSASLGVIVDGPEDLQITVVSSDPEPKTGDEIQLEITVTNAGTTPVLDIIVSTVLSDSRLRILAVDPTKGQVDLDLRVWTIGRLNEGETARLTLRALVVVPDGEQRERP